VSSPEALRAAAAVGPYFVWEPWSGDAGWRPLTDLTDPDVVAERVDAARAALIGMFGLPGDTVPERVIASVTFLGVASRLLSPPLAAVVLGGVLPAPDRLWWRPVPGGPWPIAYSGSSAGGDFGTVVVDGLVAPVLHAFQDRYVLSPQVMWGNVASALAGAAGMLADLRPDRADAAGRLAEQVLTGRALAGTGTLVRPDPSRPRRFLIRNNCCLYYRIPGGGTCGDCVLTPEPERVRGWRSVLDRPGR
jgi:hypothetical protein